MAQVEVKCSCCGKYAKEYEIFMGMITCKECIRKMKEAKQKEKNGK